VVGWDPLEPGRLGVPCLAAEQRTIGSAARKGMELQVDIVLDFNYVSTAGCPMGTLVSSKQTLEESASEYLLKLVFSGYMRVRPRKAGSSGRNQHVLDLGIRSPS
jgi:hypothetical protein